MDGRVWMTTHSSLRCIRNFHCHGCACWSFGKKNGEGEGEKKNERGVVFWQRNFDNATISRTVEQRDDA